jgi:hypothetical protein
MNSLPTWAWWIVAAGVLLSPVFAFLLALAAEILIGVLKEAGLPALLSLMAAGAVGRLLFRKLWARPSDDAFIGDPSPPR